MKKNRVLRIMMGVVLVLTVVISNVTVFATVTPVVPDPPSLYYSFDQGTASDISGNNNNGTLTGSVPPVLTTAKRDNGVCFGGNGYIETPSSSTLNLGTGDFSIAFWVKTTSAYGYILDKRASNDVGYCLEIMSGVPLLQINDPVNGFYNYYNFSSTRVDDGVWHYVVFTVDRDSTTGVKLYIDGQQKFAYNATYRTGNIDNTANLLIGRHKSGSMLNGCLDELRIYKRLLNDTERQVMYSDFFNCAKFSFDNNLYDMSGNGNNVSLWDTFGYVQGARGQALDITSTVWSPSAPDKPTLNFGTGDFTITSWVKTFQQDNNNMVIVSKGMNADYNSGYDLRLASGYVGLMLKVNGTYGSYGWDVKVDDGNWHLVAVTVDRDSTTGVKIYVDGVLTSTESAVNSMGNLDNTAPLYIGNPGCGCIALKGAVDETRLYNRALTSAEITAIYQN